MHIINSKFEILCNATNAHANEIPLQSCGRILLRSQNGATDTKIDLSAINKQLEETIRVARQVKEAEAAAAAAAQSSGSPIAQAPIPLKSNEPIQLSFNNELSSVSGNSGASTGSSSSIGATDVKALNTNDLQLSESKSPAIDELSLDSVEDTADLDDRNKR